MGEKQKTTLAVTGLAEGAGRVPFVFFRSGFCRLQHCEKHFQVTKTNVGSCMRDGMIKLFTLTKHASTWKLIGSTARRPQGCL